MTENTNETRTTVQAYRHAARRDLTNAREQLALRTEATHEVYLLLNGQIEEVIRGVVGLSQEEQVSRLQDAHAKVQAGLEALPEKVAEARESIIDQMDGWEDSITAKANEALATLAEAVTFAAERDFEAHQSRKGKSVPPASSFDEDDEEQDEDDDES